MRGRPLPSPSEIEASAEEFRRCYAHDTLGPLSIDTILEHDLGVEIVPVRNLCRYTRSKAWVCNGGKMIVVDKHILRDQPEEYRQVLTHETGHIVRHWDSLPKEPFTSIDDCCAFHDRLSTECVAVMEWEATQWAGRATVPRRLLQSTVVAKAQQFAWLFDVVGRESGEVLQEIVVQAVAERFGVIPSVAERRMRDDGLLNRLINPRSLERLLAG